MVKVGNPKVNTRVRFDAHSLHAIPDRALATRMQGGGTQTIIIRIQIWCGGTYSREMAPTTKLARKHLNANNSKHEKDEGAKSEHIHQLRDGS